VTEGKRVDANLVDEQNSSPSLSDIERVAETGLEDVACTPVVEERLVRTQ
jgi:hypothetical protein